MREETQRALILLSEILLFYIVRQRVCVGAFLLKHATDILFGKYFVHMTMYKSTGEMQY